MQSPGREPSMEDILASIKKVIAEEKELRTAARPPERPRTSRCPRTMRRSDEVDVLELDEPLAPPVDLGPPLLDEEAAGHSREALEQLSTIAATRPAAPQVNPLEDMVREMLKPDPQAMARRASAADRRRACEARDHRGSPGRPLLELAALTRAALLRLRHDQAIAPRSPPRPPRFAATPLAARPMTATDMHIDAPPRRARGLARRATGRCSPCPTPTRRRTSATTRSTCST